MHRKEEETGPNHGIAERKRLLRTV